MSPSKGFTLVELAVALGIIALLLAGALIPLSTQIDVRNVTETRRTMESIREAIIGFAQATGRLPCPANGGIASGAAGAGTEVVTGTAPNETCTNVIVANAWGVVPWATLGVPETDSWGRRFSYWTSANFADGIFIDSSNCPTMPIPAPTQSSFALCSLGTLTVNTRRESDHLATPIGPLFPAVIISHGKNGAGAFTVNGGARLGVPPGTDEAANATNGSTVFYSRTHTPRALACNEAAGPPCEFDDVVVMITSNLLATRLVAAGRLP